MCALISFPMPFPTASVTFTPPTYGDADSYGNPSVTYDEDSEVETTCCYVPTENADAIEDGRPHAEQVALTLYLPKTFAADIRGAKAVLDSGDDVLDAMEFMVRGMPVSYMRGATPGDYSWVVEVVENLG